MLVNIAVWKAPSLRDLESERKKKEKDVFVERKKESYGEYEKVREMKRMKKKKKTVGNHWEK